MKSIIIGSLPLLMTAKQLYDHMDGGLMDKEDRDDFDVMTESTKKHHLEKIFHKADYNKDGLLEEDELQRWISIVSAKYLDKDVDNQWPAHDKNNDGKISWEEYRSSVYDHMSDEDFEDQDLSLEQMSKRDERRFITADEDHDGNLSRKEFAAFLHPEDYSHMKPIVVKETLEDLDLDGDGFISEDEYIKDIYANDDDHNPNQNHEERPKWLQIEYEHFRTIRDINRDGKLDESEVQKWLMPIDYDHVVVEARHLIDEADSNNDDKLSLDEVLGDYELWITSQATNWGEALSYHDEL